MESDAVPPYFARSEFEARLAKLRQEMERRGVSLLLVSAPENIFYLTGLDHWGYFAPHMLMVPLEGDLTLAARAMERVTVKTQVEIASFEGHGDTETAADAVSRIIDRGSRRRHRIGIEIWSSGLPLGLAEALKTRVANADWIDLSGMVDDIRMVKSPAEQAYMRCAAAVSEKGAAAAIRTAREGVSERQIAAECERAMIAAGSTFPGFGPFVRSTGRLGEEHTSWTSRHLRSGDALFLELSGCVARYHAPLGRLLHICSAPPGTHEVAAICRDAFEALVGAMRQGALFGDVYAAWQAVVDWAGLSHYRRHHCGYVVGIGVPPSWTGGNKVTGLRGDSSLQLETGMCFHALSWLMGTGRGDFFVSNTVLLGENGPEVLTRTPSEVVAA
jgi:Xaa-Pro dipeptidase